jgi:hypothetical protein
MQVSKKIKKRNQGLRVLSRTLSTNLDLLLKGSEDLLDGKFVVWFEMRTRW